MVVVVVVVISYKPLTVCWFLCIFFDLYSLIAVSKGM